MHDPVNVLLIQNCKLLKLLFIKKLSYLSSFILILAD